MSKPAKRRVVPELVSPAAAVPAQAAFAATSSSQPAVPAQAAPLVVTTEQLKEQAALAKQALGPGRRVYVDLATDARNGYEVNWQRVRTLSS